MEQISVIHIRSPHHIHIAAKVAAAKRGTTMNRYILDLIARDVGKKGLEDTEQGIRMYREASPPEKKTLVKAAEIMNKMEVPDKVAAPLKPLKIAFPDTKAANVVCKIHDLPLDSRGRCLQKGCKYA